MDKTIFRIYPDGDVIALFPQIAADVGGWFCESYMHVGQHGAADPQIVVKQTRPATPKEYQELLAELEQIGYNPKPVKRFTYKNFQVRKSQYIRINSLSETTKEGFVANLLSRFSIGEV